MKNEIENFVKIVNEIVELKKKKASDYGNSWRIFGLVGIYYQIGNKFFRLWNLTQKNKDPKNESLRDTLRDMAVYCIMAMQLIDSGEKEPQINNWLYKEFVETKQKRK